MFGVIIWFVIMGFVIVRAIKVSQKQLEGSQQRIQQPMPVHQEPVMKQSVVEQLQQKRLQQQAAQGGILARAKANAKAYADDTTMEELEESHGHSSHVESTGALDFQERQKEMHPHDAAHVAAELAASEGQLMESVEDLIVKGYDGHLSFERDFLGEGMDMIARFSLQPISMNIEMPRVGE